MKLRWMLEYYLVLGLISLTLPAQTQHGTASGEDPRGVIDGVNFVFTLAFVPLPLNSLHLYRNGVRQRQEADYKLSVVQEPSGPQAKIKFIPLPIQPPGTVPVVIPTLGDSLLADYTY